MLAKNIFLNLQWLNLNEELGVDKFQTILIQNRSAGGLYLWPRDTLPTSDSSGIHLKVGEYITMSGGGESVYAKGSGEIYFQLVNTPSSGGGGSIDELVGTSGVYTKVTTDSRGRVIFGTSLSAADIPSLGASSITSGVFDIERLPPTSSGILEFFNLSYFPTVGSVGKTYIAIDTNKTYRWTGSNYIQTPTIPVDSVAGKTGIVELTKADVQLDNVDNTSDINKPISNQQQAAINQAILDSAPRTHVGSGGVAHQIATTQSAGFMSSVDRVKLDSISGTNTGDETVISIKNKLGITVLSGSNTGDQTDIIGNAGTATVLKTSRLINGVSFDGSRDIVINAIDSTSRLESILLGAPNGVASLDSTGKVPTSQLPSYVDDVIEIDSIEEFPTIGEKGKIYIAVDTNKTYRWTGSDYLYIRYGSVDSVAGKTGIVELTKADVQLGNVDNTSDINKPISNATQNALDSKQGTLEFISITTIEAQSDFDLA